MKNVSTMLVENLQKSHPEKLINMNILQGKKFHFPNKFKLQIRPTLHILLKEKHLKNKQRQPKTSLIEKKKATEDQLKNKRKP